MTRPVGRSIQLSRFSCRRTNTRCTVEAGICRRSDPDRTEFRAASQRVPPSRGCCGLINRANRTQSMPDRVIGSRYASHLGVLPYDQFALREAGAMSDKNEQPSSRARPTSTSAWSQRRLQRGGASARTLTLVAVTAILAAGGLGSSSVAASGRSLALGSGRSGILNGSSADSATDAWAVGYYINPTTGAFETLALHWNGTKWITVSSPNPGGTSSGDQSTLSGVSAESATDAWAVGYYDNPITFATETLALHWNGTTWSKVASPNPGGTTSSSDFSSLSGVSANSVTDAWAVGAYS